MAMKDFLGKLDLDRFKRAPEENVEVPAPEPVDEKPSFVFTDVNSNPIGTDAAEVPEAPAHSGPIQVGSTNDDRIQLFELDLGGSKAAEEPPVSVPEIPELEDAVVMTSAPAPSAAEEEYEEDFGYAAPGALDDVTYTTAPETVQPAEPEPIAIETAEAPAVDAADQEEYYDSYEPLFEEDYTAGMFFQKEPAAAPAAEEPVYEEPAEETPVYEAPTYTEEQPRYENYREDYQDAAASEGPRSYENNIDDTVFLPDQGDAPVGGKGGRRRWIVALLAILLALLVVLGAVFLAHHNKSADESAAVQTSAKVKTTAFERSVSNNADATETTTEEESAMYDENGETSARTTTRTTTATRSTTRSSTSTGTTTTTSSTTRSTTTTTAAPSSTTASTTTVTAVPSTNPPTQSTTAAPSPWDHVNS